MRHPSAVKIAPSILSADFSNLGDQVQQAITAGADWIHVDVMDGHFVPNLTIGPLVVSALKPVAAARGVLLDVHLMIERPELMIPAFAKAGADRVTVHVETCPHLHRTVQQIKELGCRAGVTLNPATHLSAVEEILTDVDLVLVMSVNPGFGGQSYIASSTRRIAWLNEYKISHNLDDLEIEVDGGINVHTAPQAVSAGATVLVAGSAIFNERASIADNIRQLRASVEAF